MVLRPDGTGVIREVPAWVNLVELPAWIRIRCFDYMESILWEEGESSEDEDDALRAAYSLVVFLWCRRREMERMNLVT